MLNIAYIYMYTKIFIFREDKTICNLEQNSAYLL
jgi:hypothetical protein